jgi:hypothetical protein
LELWIDRERPEVLLCEEPLYSQRYDFAGTADLVIKRKKGIRVVDLKTTDLAQFTGPQTSAYEQLYRENTGYKGMADRYVLYLPKDGSEYHYRELTNRNDFQYFLAKLYAYNYLK